MVAFSLGFTLAPAGILIQKIRKLLQSGHEADEVVRAMKEEVEERRRALAATGESEPSRVDRLLRGLTWGSAITFAAGFTWLGWGPYIDTPFFWTLYSGIMSAAGVTFFGTGFGFFMKLRCLSGQAGQSS